MATRLYPAHNEVGVFTPATKRGAWDKTSGSAVSQLSHARMGTGRAFQNTENVATANYDVLVVTFVSDPLKDAVTISGTLDAILHCAESNADANDVLHLHAWVTQGDSDTVRGTLLADYVDATEFAVSGTLTAVSAITIPQQTLTSVSAQAGDRIVIEVGYQAQNTHTTNRTGAITGGGSTTTDATGSESAVGPSNANHPWFEFSADGIAFAYDYLYTTADAAPVTPAAVRGTWDIDNKEDVYLQRVPDATTSTRSVTETVTTNPTDGLIYRFVSDELAAQTINAVGLYGIIKQVESAGAANAFGKLHAYVMASDGSVRGTLASNLVTATEMGDLNFITSFFSTTCTSVACLAGDRIVIEVGARFTNTTTTSYSSTIAVGQTSSLSGGSSVGGTYGGASSATAASGWFRLDQDLLWLDEVPSGTDASGTVSAQALTVTGSTATGTAGQGASGTVAAQALTVTGSSTTGTAGQGATGTVAGQALAVTGSTATGTADSTTTGTVSGQALSVTGSTATGTAGQGATGTVAPHALTVTGSVATGTIIIDASGTVSGQALAVSGSTATGTAGTGATGTVAAHALAVTTSTATGVIGVVPTPVTFTTDSVPFLAFEPDSAQYLAFEPDTQAYLEFAPDSVQGDYP